MARVVMSCDTCCHVASGRHALWQVVAMSCPVARVVMSCGTVWHMSSCPVARVAMSCGTVWHVLSCPVAQCGTCHHALWHSVAHVIMSCGTCRHVLWHVSSCLLWHMSSCPVANGNWSALSHIFMPITCVVKLLSLLSPCSHPFTTPHTPTSSS